MNIQLVIDWKFVVAIGISVATNIVVAKLDSKAAENLSIHAVDTVVEYVHNHHYD